MVELIKRIYRKIVPQTIRHWFYLMRHPINEFINKYFGIKNKMPMKKKSFGNFMPGKVFYIIRREYPAGLFSNFHHVLGHIIYSIEHDYIPVIDMKNYHTFFNEKEPMYISKDIGVTLNSWEYYFKQPTTYTLENAYNGNKVILSSGEYPHDIVPYACFDPKKINYFHNIINTYMQFNEKTLNVLNDSKKNIFADKTNILGVQSRGSDHRFAKFHNKVPLLDELLRKVIVLFNEWKMEWIYLTTEESISVNKFREAFGEKLIVTNSIRIDNYSDEMGDSSGIKHCRKNDNYLKGLEYLIDIYLLSMCDSIVCSKVNGAMAAFEFNNNKYKNKFIFDIGINNDLGT